MSFEPVAGVSPTFVDPEIANDFLPLFVVDYLLKPPTRRDALVKPPEVKLFMVENGNVRKVLPSFGHIIGQFFKEIGAFVFGAFRGNGGCRCICRR